MPKTELASLFRRIAEDLASADELGVPVEEARARRREVRVSRRTFLAGAAATGAAIAVAGPLRAAALAEPPQGADPKVAIVGAGMAGLAAALTLADHGFSSNVYEATGRVGGRMDSDRTSFAAGQVTERCGELIDTGHKEMRDLARRFGLPLDDLRSDEPSGSTPTFFFDGGYYPFAQVVADFAPVYKALVADIKAAGYPTRFDAFNAAGQALDAMSVRQWIESRVPGGFASKLGQLLDVAYDIEYGLPTTQQSALNLVYLLGYQPKPLGFADFGESDERYHVRGGNDLVTSAMAGVLPAGTIVTGHALERVAARADGGFDLRFDTYGGDVVVAADVVVLAVPFSVLRTIDLGASGFSALKRTAIDELGYGTNAKLNVQFTSRHWRTSGAWGVGNGSSYSDTGYQATWEASRGQPGAEGIAVDYTGGDIGAAISASGPANVPASAAAFLAQIEPVWPGITSRWNGRATLSTPLNDPFRRGSYACWKVGQYVKFAGVEGAPEGRCLFAGEHCSQDFQGFMEGAAREGRRAGQEALKLAHALRHA